MKIEGLDTVLYNENKCGGSTHKIVLLGSFGRVNKV